MTDLGPNPFKVGDFIRQYVPDPRARLVLIITFVLMLLAALVSYFGNAERAIEAIWVTFLFLYVALLALAASIAIFPVGDQQTNREAEGAKKAQRNARGSLVLLAGLGVLAIAVIDFLVLPIWSTLTFEFQYRQLKFGNIDANGFLSKVEPAGSSMVQDLDASQIKIDDDRISDPRSFLRLFGRDEITVPNLDIRNSKGNAVIAAREIIFDNFSSIRIGNKNLYIFTSTLQLASGKGGVPIYAYGSEDVPSDIGLEPGSEGRPGVDAGNVTIVVLDEIKGGGSLMVDLRGQRGGKGSLGLQPSPKPQAASLEAVPGRPKWSFRKPEETELRTFDKYVAGQLAQSDVDHKTKEILKTNQTALSECLGSQSNCRLILCDEANWGDFARGRAGEQGSPGQKGGTGGRAGEPGVLKVYFVKSQLALRKILAAKMRWSNGDPIDQEPPRQLPSDGGDPGEPGLGGAGGQGLAGDPFGVCQSGATGKAGPPGPPGERGKSGPPAHLGVPASLTGLTLF